ncbi:hypothetical protein PG999_000679, partial [Apiospora kogelbergensis]
MDTSSAKNPELFSTDSRAAAVIVGVTVLLLVPSVAVALRFYTCRALTGRVSYDDWISLVALNLGFACGITIAYMTRVGLGHHIGTITQSQSIREYIKAFYLSVIFYNAGIMFVKLSFLAMYYRAVKAPRWRKLIAFVSVLVFAWEVTQVFAAIFFCRPFPSNRDGTSERVKCTAYLPEWYQNTAGNIVLNAIILLLSIPMIRSMTLTWAQKAALAGIFCLGLFTLATSIIRIKFLGMYLDTTFDNVDAALWSLCEINAGLTCACLPTLGPLAARYFPAQFGYPRNGAVMINRHRKMIPPPLPLHQRPFWYGADSPGLRYDTGRGPLLNGGKTVARSITTDIGEDEYDHEVQKQQQQSQATTTMTQRPTLSRLISLSSRRHSSPEGSDQTEIIVIGLQCARRSIEENGGITVGGSGGVQQPVPVYRGWRNSESSTFSPQHHGIQGEIGATTLTTAPVPATPYWLDERSIPIYHYPESPPPPFTMELPRRVADGNNYVMDIHSKGYESEGETARTTLNTRNTAQ